MYTVYDVINTIMCTKSGKYHKPECINDEYCTNMEGQLEAHYAQLLSMELGMLKYKAWEYQDVACNARKGKGFVTVIKRKDCNSGA